MPDGGGGVTSDGRRPLCAGLDTVEKARAFLSVRKPAAPPLMMADMERAAERIRLAWQRGRPLLFTEITTWMGSRRPASHRLSERTGRKGDPPTFRTGWRRVRP